MLSADAKPIQDLSESLFKELGVDSGDGIAYLENMHGVMAQLIESRAVTQTQADEFFAEKTLGSFARIFLKYTLVELKERGFAQDDLLNFVSHFGDVYTAINQVQFALDVARRMLLTLNEQTDISSAQGLQNFLAQAQFFGVVPAIFANFLKLWVHVRVAHPKTIVHFILGNIRNAGRVLREHAETTHVRGTWPRFRAGATNPELVNEILNLISIPDSISQPRASFKLNVQTYDTFLARYWAKADADLRSYLKILALRSPFALDAIVYNQLPEMTFRRLAQFVQTPQFKDLSAPTVKRGLDLLSEYEKFGALESRLKTYPTSVETEPPLLSRTINLDFVIMFQIKMKKSSDRSAVQPRNERSVRDNIIRHYRELQKDQTQIGSETFLLLAKILTLNLRTNDRANSLGTAMALVEMSRESDLDADQIHELIRLVGWLGNGFGSRAKDSPDFEFAMRPDGWGNPDFTATQAVASSEKDLPPELESLLLEIREFLLRHGIYLRNLETLQYLMHYPDSPRSRQYLEMSN